MNQRSVLLPHRHEEIMPRLLGLLLARPSQVYLQHRLLLLIHQPKAVARKILLVQSKNETGLAHSVQINVHVGAARGQKGDDLPLIGKTQVVESCIDLSDGG